MPSVPRNTKRTLFTQVLATPYARNKSTESAQSITSDRPRRSRSTSSDTIELRTTTPKRPARLTRPSLPAQPRSTVTRTDHQLLPVEIGDSDDEGHLTHDTRRETSKAATPFAPNAQRQSLTGMGDQMPTRVAATAAVIDEALPQARTTSQGPANALNGEKGFSTLDKRMKNILTWARAHPTSPLSHGPSDESDVNRPDIRRSMVLLNDFVVTLNAICSTYREDQARYDRRLAQDYIVRVCGHAFTGTRLPALNRALDLTTDEKNVERVLTLWETELGSGKQLLWEWICAAVLDMDDVEE